LYVGVIGEGEEFDAMEVTADVATQPVVEERSREDGDASKADY
jgi:hypothetical protein